MNHRVNLEEKSSKMLKAMWREGGRMSSGPNANSMWSKLHRQKSNLKRAEAAAAEKAAREKAAREKKSIDESVALTAINKRKGWTAVRPIGFGSELPKGKSTEEQLAALKVDVGRNHETTLASTERLLESHAQLLTRIAQLEEANAAVLKKLHEATSGSFHQGRMRRHMNRQLSRQAMTGEMALVTTSAAPEALAARMAPSAATGTATASELRAEIREEMGAQQVVLSSPFDA